MFVEASVTIDLLQYFCHVCLSTVGDAHMSPGVLAELWKEEQDRIKVLEEKMKVLLREKQVTWLL